jgi:hypothetical protein
MKTYRTKTFWTGLGSILGAVGFALSGDYATAAQLAATGLASIFLRNAISKMSVD